jgi:hypothetical protein
MRLLRGSESGGTRHYTVEPENSSDLGQPTEEFRKFVRDLSAHNLSWEPVSTAVSLGQFQHKVGRAFVGGRSTETPSGTAGTDVTGETSAR